MQKFLKLLGIAVLAALLIMTFSCDSSGGGGNESTDPGTGLTITIPGSSVTISFVKINKGSFTMGPDIWNNDAEVEVTLTKDFYMGNYTVTQEQYAAVMGENPSWFTPDNGKNPDGTEVQVKRPVETVNWYHAIAFCNRLSILAGFTPVYTVSGISNTDADAWKHSEVPTGNNTTWNAAIMSSTANGYRLPTDAEWEYACKAGTSSKWHFGDDETKLEEYAWYGWDDTWTVPQNSNEKTHQVGLLKANQWGLYDMHGNVWEWCWDWYGDYPAGPEIDYDGTISGAYRVIRGGSWYDSAGDTQSVGRDGAYPSGMNNTLGFRVVRR